MMQKKVQLQKKFELGGFNHGASTLKQLLWYFTSVLFFRSGLVPFSVILVEIL